jgi:histidine phosphotransfer protein HptB
MTLPAIDPHTFDELQARLGPDFVLELVQTFDEEAPRLLAELQRAAAAGDIVAFRRAAHTLKGDSRTFGAAAMAQALARLDEAGPADAAALQGLAQAVASAQAALRDMATR